MKNLILKNILDNIGFPVALFSESGEIFYQNSLFEKLNIENHTAIKEKFAKSYIENEFSFEGKTYKLIKIENNNQIQQDFLSTVSHELRTPLTSIRGFADTMLLSRDKLTDEQTHKFLSIIRAQADRLTRLVENLLEISKISQQTQIIRKEIKFQQFISPIITIFEKKYPLCKFVCNIENTLPHIYTDSDILEQILTNLIDNASKYSKDNSTIKIEALIQNNTFKIKIFDEAEKIPEAYFEKIFNKFSRIDSPLTRKVEGTGLGLYITKALVNKLNGGINVFHYENGNVFQVSLPVYTLEERLQLKVGEGR